MNFYPLLKDSENQQYILLEISYKSKGEMQTHDLKDKSKEQILEIFKSSMEEENQYNKTTQFHEKRFYLSEKKRKRCLLQKSKRVKNHIIHTCNHVVFYNSLHCFTFFVRLSQRIYKKLFAARGAILSKFRIFIY